MICLADYLQEVKTLLNSLLFSILSKAMLLLRFWPGLPFRLVDWFFSIASERTVEPFCLTCFVISLRCVLRFGIAPRCMRLVCGGVSTGFPGQNVSESNVFSTAIDTFISITCLFFNQCAVKPSGSLKLRSNCKVLWSVTILKHLPNN